LSVAQFADLYVTAQNFLQVGNNFRGHWRAPAFCKCTRERSAAGRGHSDDDLVNPPIWYQLYQVVAVSHDRSIHDYGANFLRIVINEAGDFVSRAIFHFFAQHHSGSTSPVEKYAFGDLR